MENIKRLHLLISGDVTGVGFRLSAVYIARDLGLTGWVRNTPAGGVEIIAEGPEEKLENFVTWAHKGPPIARVDRVKVEWQDSPPAGGEKFTGFEVRK